MSDTVDSDRMPAEVGPEAQVDAALRAALGPSSMAVHRNRCGVLDALRLSSGVTLR
jgi:hypothetical protein